MQADDHHHLEDLRKDSQALREQSDQLILALKQLVHYSRQLRNQRKTPIVIDDIVVTLLPWLSEVFAC